MPDDLQPAAEPTESAAQEPSTPAVETPAAAAVPDTAAANDAIYNEAAKELMAEDLEGDATPTPAPEAKPAVAAEKPAQTPAEAAKPLDGPVLSESEEQALRRAGLEPEDWKAWDRTKIEGRVATLRKTQIEQDRLGSELDRLKKAQPAEETKPKEEAPRVPTTPISKKLADMRAKLVEAYDAEINPLLDVIDEIDGSIQPLVQQAAVVPLLSELVGELVLDQVIADLAQDYPSINKPEARTKVNERFWQEWNTGAYSKQGVPLRQQLRNAATNAAKVTFITTTEQSAAANLVIANRNRVASQPKTSPIQARSSKSLPADDVYDQVFNETLAPELRK